MLPGRHHPALLAGVLGTFLATAVLTVAASTAVQATGAPAPSAPVNVESSPYALAISMPFPTATSALSTAETFTVPPIPTTSPAPQQREIDPLPVVLPITDGLVIAEYGVRGPNWAVAHSGLDFQAPMGTPAHAVFSGTIRAVFTHPAFGNVVELLRSDGVEVWYCHLSSILVAPGSEVTQGQVVGLTGATGNVTGPHLHFEVRVDNVPTDPRVFLFGTPGVPTAPAAWAFAYREEPPPGSSVVPGDYSKKPQRDGPTKSPKPSTSPSASASGSAKPSPSPTSANSPSESPSPSHSPPASQTPSATPTHSPKPTPTTSDD